MKTLIIALAALTLSACQSLSPQRYITVPDNTSALRNLVNSTAKIEPFTMSALFDDSCRGGTTIAPPVNMTFQGYFQAAFADEFKVAGIYNDTNPNVVLSGNIDKLAFSSSKGVTNGEWIIGLKISSSNGKSMNTLETYQFESGFEGGTACRRTADAFLPAVQNIIGKVIRTKEFSSLLEN